MFKKLITGDVDHATLLTFIPFGIGYLNAADTEKPCMHSLSFAMMLQSVQMDVHPGGAPKDYDH